MGSSEADTLRALENITPETVPETTGDQCLNNAKRLQLEHNPHIMEQCTVVAMYTSTNQVKPSTSATALLVDPRLNFSAKQNSACVGARSPVPGARRDTARPFYAPTFQNQL